MTQWNGLDRNSLGALGFSAETLLTRAGAMAVNIDSLVGRLEALSATKVATGNIYNIFSV